MRLRTLTSGASALLVLATTIDAKSDSHNLHEAFHRRNREKQAREAKSEIDVGKRSGQCQFPTNVGLVAVTPGSANAGWAMSPDQTCTPGSYCPYACPPGQVSMQWDPSATSYTYPLSMNGGLYCDSNGQISKPFPNQPYCQATSANIGVVNNAGSTVSFCQTVLPGNEAMLIPTEVDSSATLANPGTNYWCETAAHYYINPPGTSTAEACVWGTNAQPVGNWAPYVAGSNTDASGNTYIKLGWNPIYLEQATPFRTEMPTWGVEIECPNGGCNGLPCSIDPSLDTVNSMSGSGISYGAGGASFCVVTVNKGSTANFVVFEGSASGTSKSASSSSSTWSNWNGGGANTYANYASGSASSHSTTATSTTSNALGISSGGVNLGGQFYASTATTQTTATTTTTTTTTTSATPTSTISTTEVPVYTTWTGYNITTGVPTAPSGSPYYSLFNSSLLATKTGSDESPSESGSASSTITIATHTGGASHLGMAAVGFAVALWSLLM